MKTNRFGAALPRLLLAGLLAWAVRHWAWAPLLIVGNSMQPTLPDGSLMHINKLAYRLGQPRRGDIVAIETDQELIVKRIIGLPEEEIRADHGLFYVNGSRLAEPYVRFKQPDNVAPGRLGANRFVVAGDNRQGTIIAVVGRDRIIGRVAAAR